MKKNILLSLIFLSLLIQAQSSFAAWLTPTEIIASSWGSGETQFGIEKGDSHDIFPAFFDISNDGYIVVTDGVNGRFKLFAPTGDFIANINPPLNNPQLWVINPRFLGQNIVLPAGKYFFFNHEGQLVNVMEKLGGIDYWTTYNEKLFVRMKNTDEWKSFSPTGELLQNYTERPLELGRVETKRIGSKQYKTTVTYPDKVWTIIEDGNLEDFIRDASGNLFGISGKKVVRFDAEGKFISEVIIPENQYNRTPVPEGVPHPTGYISEVIAEYGKPVVGPNGDVYTWKRTPETYSIIKWVWQD